MIWRVFYFSFLIISLFARASEPIQMRESQPLHDELRNQGLANFNWRTHLVERIGGKTVSVEELRDTVEDAVNEYLKDMQLAAPQPIWYIVKSLMLDKKRSIYEVLLNHNPVALIECFENEIEKL